MLKNHTYLKFLFFLLVLLPGASWAQNFADHNWYFGNTNQSIRFSRSDNSASLLQNKVVPFATGGSGVASSKLNGNLLFYTDGLNVYDISNQVMPNGDLSPIPNPNTNQPVAIAKVPGQVNQYYVFTNDTNFGNIAFTIVDMSLPGNSIFPAPPSGEVIPASKNSPVIAGQSEAMIIVPHALGENFWLITHANGTNDFNVILFTPTGLTSITTITGLGLIQIAANFSYHEKTKHLAVSPQEPTRDVEILNFDPLLGSLILNQRVVNSGLNSTSTQAIYDTEWSNSGQYLYLSNYGEAPTIQADVLQYDFLAASLGLNPTLISVLPQPNTIFGSYGLQMAPDSAIYHLYQSTAGGPFLLGKLTNTDTIPTQVVYTPQAFAGNIDFDGFQFPAFASGDTTGISITFQPVTACANTPVTFYPTVNPGADSIRWDFGDGAKVSDWSPVHTYTTNGNFTVTATAFLNGDSIKSTQPATISQFDLKLSLVSDTTACVCEYKPPVGSSCNGGPFNVTVQAQNGTPTYQWFGPSGLLAGQTTTNLIPDSAGYYYVVATVGLCQAHAGVNIKTYDSLDQRANIWYFGQNAGIDFNPLPNNPAVAIQNPVMDTPEGTSTISDRNGQVIFFTDGDKVWNRAFTEVASGIGGSKESTQSALIVPVPGDETLYYIFTTQQVDGFPTAYELRYSVYDIKLNGNTGGLVDTDGNAATFLGTLLFAKSTERITSNGNWLIAHEFGNNSFRAYPITAQGIGNPVISSIGSDHNFSPPQEGQGYMELGGQGNLAVALSTGTSNTVEIFDFTDSSGVISNYRVADLKIPTGQVYGLEFSGSKLLTTWSDGTDSKIAEFFFNAGDSVFAVRKPPISRPGEYLGAIQTGPDGQVYVAVEGATALGTIQVNGDTLLASTYTPNAFPLYNGPLGGTSSHLGLPNFIQTLSNAPQTPGITFTGVCLGSPTDFTGSGKDSNIDLFDWYFGDGSSVLNGQPQVSHTYALAKTYIATLVVHNKCQDTVAKYTRQVIVAPPPAPPIAPGVVSLCTAASVLLEATAITNPDLSKLDFLWSTGDTTRTITVSNQAVYDITITDNLGCSSSGSTILVDNRPLVDLPPNTDVCQNIVLASLDAQNPTAGTIYDWTINTVPAGSTQNQAVDTSIPGVFEYRVTVTSPGPFGCNATDSIIYTVKQAPVIANIGKTDAPGCGNNLGAITFDITGPLNTYYSYFVTGTTPIPNATDQLLGTYPFMNLLAGTYGITVQDQVSFCFDTNIATINDLGSAIPIVTNPLKCDPIGLHVVHTATASAFTFRVIDALSGQVVFSGGLPSSPGFFDISMPGVLPGTYVVEVTSGVAPFQCIVSSVPLASGNPLTVVSFDITDICNGNLTAITVPAANTFNWTGLVTPANSSTVTLLPGTGTVTLTAVDLATSCPGTASIDVTDFIADFTLSDACQDQVTLSAIPVGTFNYQWTRNGIPILGGQQIIASLTDDGLSYAVTVTNTLVAGCPESSNPQVVQVDGLLDVFLTATPTCEGIPFTVTATENRPSTTKEWFLDATQLPDTDLDVVSTSPGTFKINITAGACPATADFPVGNLATSTPGLLNNEAIICPEGTDDVNQVVLDPGAGFFSYNWFLNDVQLNNTDPTYTARDPGQYTVDLINSFGCTSNDKTQVNEECNPIIVGPTAFRPTSSVQEGGEMVNQSFKLFTFFIDDENFQVFIFNRWGEMIYQTTDRNFRWNGGYNNNLAQPMQGDTYSYVVKYKSSYRPEDGVQEKRGGVVLLR